MATKHCTKHPFILFGQNRQQFSLYSLVFWHVSSFPKTQKLNFISTSWSCSANIVRHHCCDCLNFQSKWPRCDDEDDDESPQLERRVSAHCRDLLSDREIFGLHKSTRVHRGKIWREEKLGPTKFRENSFGPHKSTRVHRGKKMGLTSPHCGNI